MSVHTNAEEFSKPLNTRTEKIRILASGKSLGRRTVAGIDRRSLYGTRSWLILRKHLPAPQDAGDLTRVFIAQRRRARNDRRRLRPMYCPI
jgi:hypothetical protein